MYIYTYTYTYIILPIAICKKSLSRPITRTSAPQIELAGLLCTILLHYSATKMLSYYTIAGILKLSISKLWPVKKGSPDRKDKNTT